jgi:uncharacterized phage-associated protein
MGKNSNNNAVRDLVESKKGHGPGREGMWKRAENMGKLCIKKDNVIRVVEMQDEVKELQKHGKGKERVAQEFGRVDSSSLEKIESSEEHQCVINSCGEILGNVICLSFPVFWTFMRFAAALYRNQYHTHCSDSSSVRQ